MVITQEGSAGGDKFFLCTTNSSGSIGSVNITFTTVQPSNVGDVTLNGTQTLTNKTLTDAVAITNSVTGEIVPGKLAGTNFTNSILVGHATTGTLNAAEQNTGVGIGAMNAIVSGDNNSAFGFDSGGALTGGQRNTYFGASSGEQNVSSNDNTGFGQKTLEESGVSGATSTGNSAFGMQSLNKVNSGDYNLGLGWKAGDNLTTGSGNVIIGSVDAAAVDSARTLKIAGYDGSTTTTWISGDSSGNVTVGGTLTTSSGAVAAQADVTALAIALG